MPDQLNPNVPEPNLENKEADAAFNYSAESLLIENGAIKTKPEDVLGGPEKQNLVNRLLEHKITSTAVLAILTLALGFVIFASVTNGEKRPSGYIIPTDATNTTDATNYSETVTPTEISYAKPPKSVVEGYDFQSLSDDEKAELKKIEAMSLEEYYALPETERLQDNWAIYENMKGRFDAMNASINNQYKYVENPTTADEYMGNNIYMLAFMSLTMKTDTGEGGEGIAEDHETGKKIMELSYIMSEKNIDLWGGTVDSALNAGGISPTYEVEAFKMTPDGMVVNGYWPSGDDMTWSGGDLHLQQTYRLVTFKAFDGTTHTISQCILSVSSISPDYIDITSSN